METVQGGRASAKIASNSMKQTVKGESAYDCVLQIVITAMIVTLALRVQERSHSPLMSGSLSEAST